VSTAPTHLTLLRHAKSSWDEPGLADHDRPLAARGRKACRRLSAWLGDSGPRPELVLCSTAVRARQTLAPLLQALGEPPVRYEEGLYHAAGGALQARIAELDPALVEVLLVGHNPGLHDLVLLLAAPSPALERVREKLPTGALVRLRLDDGWSSRTAAVVELVLPRELD
jgi:phosphohistidine phosphatase